MLSGIRANGLPLDVSIIINTIKLVLRRVTARKRRALSSRNGTGRLPLISDNNGRSKRLRRGRRCRWASKGRITGE